MATSEAQQQAALRQLTELARREIRAALGLVDVGDAAAVADVIYTYVPVIADRYGLAAGTLAADWYDELRDAAEVAGYFRAEPAALPSDGRYRSMAAWAAGKDDIEALVSGGVQRIIADAHRDTVRYSSFADPRAAGWARFARGTETCEFCYMLVSRGAVYSDDSAKFGSHDNCDCGAGPIWRGSAGTRKVDDYKKSARRREIGDELVGPMKADQERARDWIAENL